MLNKKVINEWRNVILGTWIEHDEISCNALREYENTVDFVKSPYKHMQQIADEHGTTIQKMKEHWKCIQIEN